ncbi:putative uncharacterized protein [Prevotella sp. CAG:924]|nr:putative uncharacterized protein [Prevotella sp. CAG:924]
MKKIVFTLIASMVMTAALADTPKTTTANNANAANYDMTVNYNRLAVALNLDGDQIESVKLIHGDYIKAMNAAAKASEAEKKEMVRKATQKELARLRYVLDRDQYRKYNMLINATLTNRGLID